MARREIRLSDVRERYSQPIERFSDVIAAFLRMHAVTVSPIERELKNGLQTCLSVCMHQRIYGLRRQ
jgi:hypothetical protein